MPPLRAAMRVRSEGAILNDAAIGPPPLASFPWQVAQYALNSSGPLNESMSCFSCVDSGAFFCAAQTASARNAPATMYVPIFDFIMVSFELGIASVQLHGQFRNRANALESSNTGLFAVPK